MRKFLAPESNDTFVVTRGFEQCLFIYPMDEWILLEQQVRKLSNSDPRNRFFRRALLEWAIDVQLDAQSRVIIPKELLQFGRIENAALILGVLEHIEVWNPEVYKEYMRSQPESYEDVAQRVFSK